MSNTIVRIIVAVVAIPIILLLVMKGGWYFTAFVELIAVLGLKEYYDMARAKGTSPQAGVGLVAGAVVPVMLHIALAGGNSAAIAFALLAFFFLFTIGVLGIELWRAKANPIVNTAITVFGVLYAALCMGGLIGVRNVFSAPWNSGQRMIEDQGQMLVFLMFGAIWICDSAAYFVGRAIGKHKIAPSVSPNKSWEGGIAGLIGSAAAFGGLSQVLLPELPFGHALILGTLVGIVGQIGDFAESMLKRDAGIKDSSAIIPGHGGLLDRFDSVLFAAPVVFVYISLWLILK